MRLPLFKRCVLCYTDAERTEEGERMRLLKKKGPQYDTERQMPVIRQSICTGEKTAGFKDLETGRFTEVMLIRTQKDLDDFRTQYGIEDPIKTIY